MSTSRHSRSHQTGSSSTRHVATVNKVAEVMRTNIGLIRILFKQLGHKDLNPKRLEVLQEIVDRWDFDSSESRVVDALLRSARPMGGRDVVDYHSFVKLVRQPSGTKKTSNHQLLNAVSANIPQPPGGSGGPRPPSTCGTSRTGASQGVHPSLTTTNNEVDHSRDILARNVQRELLEHLNAAARETGGANHSHSRKQQQDNNNNNGGELLQLNNQAYDGALTLPQFTKAIRQFEDRVGPVEARNYFFAAAQSGGEHHHFEAAYQSPAVGTAGGRHAQFGPETHKTVKCSQLAKATFKHLPLTRHKAFSSEQVRETFSWPISFAEEIKHPSALPIEEAKKFYGQVAAGAARNVSLNKTTRNVELKKMLSKEWHETDGGRGNQLENVKFSIWSPRRLAAEGKASPRAPKRPHAEEFTPRPPINRR